MQDTRNVTDDFKHKPHEAIVAALDERGVDMEIAVENNLRDYNMGTIVRTANAFGVRHIHIVGRRQWNKRGAMATDKYMHVHYHNSIDEFIATVADKELIAVDNVEGSRPLDKIELPKNSILIFGAEGPGISDEMLSHAKQIVAIEQIGSTRSINVGVAAGIVMYEWLRRHRL